MFDKNRFSKLMEHTINDYIENNVSFSAAVTPENLKDTEMFNQELLEALDTEALANEITELINKRVMTYEITYIPVDGEGKKAMCPKCFRPFGRFISKGIAGLDDSQILVHGKSIINVDDF